MTDRYDVVVVGGAIAGASTALLLRRRQPHLRVLVIERNPAFDWKVGESTVEVSSYFLVRVLKMYDHLSREHLAKQSFRYWFHNGDARCLHEASEVGPYHLARTPGFQLDRAKLDEHILAQAVKEGAELWRPAKVLDIRLAEETGETENILRVERDGETLEVRTPWLVDASGRAAVVARKRGWLKPLDAHPTSSVWARFRDVKDLDGVEAGGTCPDSCYARSSIASRRLATNHFTGYGYWMWFIPLKGGETSIGAVWDRRIVEPEGKTPREKLDWFLQGNPLTKEMMENAKIEPDDLRMYANLPYLCDRVCGTSWSAVGDAAGFLDPFYSPGLDQMAFSVWATLDLLERRKDPNRQKFEKHVAFHNSAHYRFMSFFFESIYKDKYYLMGDYDTMTASFLIDTSIYYFTVVWALYKRQGSAALLTPPYYPEHSEFVMWMIRWYQQRLVKIARRKWALGTYGNHNHGRRPRLVGFDMGQLTIRMYLKGLRFWLRAEIANAISYVLPQRRVKAPGPYRAPTMASSLPDVDIPVPMKAGRVLPGPEDPMPPAAGSPARAENLVLRNPRE